MSADVITIYQAVLLALADLAGPLDEWVKHDSKRMRSHVLGSASTWMQMRGGRRPSDDEILSALDEVIAEMTDGDGTVSGRVIDYGCAGCLTASKEHPCLGHGCARWCERHYQDWWSKDELIE